MKVVVDAMGGDLAPQPAVEGAVRACRSFGVPIVLVGCAPEISAALEQVDATGLPITVAHASQVVGMEERSPASAIRAEPDNSISRGMTLVRQGAAQAFVTIGNTGAALAGATLRLGRAKGVRRPALATPFPTTNGPCVLIDIGANADVRASFLLQFAIMGSAYAERVLGVAKPRVGLVSIGEERGKGRQVVRDAHPLLETSGLNFIGNIEGRDIPLGGADVAVMDGSTGNVVIKFAEGTAALVGRILRDAATGDPLAVLGGMLMRPALRRARGRMDYRSYGGAVLLGVRGVVVIGHGRSDAAAVEAAVGVAIRGVEQDLVGAIERQIARVGHVRPSERAARTDGESQSVSQVAPPPALPSRELGDPPPPAG